MISGPERLKIGPWPTQHHEEVEYIRADLHEAVVRELAEAREKLESVTVVKDGMIRVSKELSDEVEKLRALLDEAPHTHNCDGWAWEINPCLGTWEPEYVRVMHDEKCSCYRSRIPRAGG